MSAAIANVAPKVVICFCGADLSWEELVKFGFRRRHSCLLQEWVKHPEVARVFVFSNVTRATYRELMARPASARASTDGKVVDVYVTGLLPERSWLPGTQWLNRWFKRRQVERQVKGLAALKPVVWCYWPRGYQMACDLNLPGKWFFDADHNIIDDPNLDPGEQSQMQEFLRQCARRVQLVTAASRSMLEWFRQNGCPNGAFLRNGVDPKRFESAATPPAELQRIPHPRIGYVGTLSRWVNYELLTAVAKRRPDWNFVMAGPAFKRSESFGFDQLPNVTFLGERREHEVPGLLAGFDVGLVPYKCDRWLDGDSMKIFEYLAVGLPVVSTSFHPELQVNFGGLLRLAADAAEFEQAIAAALKTSDAEKLSDVARRREFIAANTWACRAAEAVRLMQADCKT